MLLAYVVAIHTNLNVPMTYALVRELECHSCVVVYFGQTLSYARLVYSLLEDYFLGLGFAVFRFVHVVKYMPDLI